MNSTSSQLVERFAKVLSPQPEIHSFPDLKGLWFDSIRLPAPSHRVILGMSEQLFQEVSDGIMEASGRDIAEEFRVRRVGGCREVIPVVTSYEAPSDHPVSPLAPKMLELILQPKRIEVGYDL